MLPLDVQLKVSGINISHLEATIVALASCPLLARLNVLVAGVLLVDAGVVLLHRGLLGGGLLVVSNTRLGWSLRAGAAGGWCRGLRVPHHEIGEAEERIGERLKGVFERIRSKQLMI